MYIYTWIRKRGRDTSPAGDCSTADGVCLRICIIIIKVRLRRFFFFYTYNNITYTFVFMRSVETIIYVGRRGFRGVERTVVGRCGVGREKKNNGLPDVFTVFILYIRTYVCIYYIRVERSTTSPSSFFKKKCFFFLLFLFVYYVHM